MKIRVVERSACSIMEISHFISTEDVDAPSTTMRKAIWATIVPVWQSTAAYLSRKEIVSQTYRIVVLLLLPLQPFHRFSLLLLDAHHSKLHELNFNKINNEIQQTLIGLSYVLVNPTILKQDTSVRKIASISSHLYTKKAAFERRNSKTHYRFVSDFFKPEW